MSIKFYAIGDVHIAKRHISLSQEAMAGTLKLLEKQPSVDMVVIMGDVLDTHDNVKMTYQHMAIKWIRDLIAIADKEEKKSGRRIVIAVLIGNHDRPNNTDFFSDKHPFMGMEDIQHKLYIVNKPKAIIVNDRKVLFMPYVSPGRFEDGFNTYLKAMHNAGKWNSIKSIRDFSLIFAHQEFKGAAYGPIKSVSGDDWPLSYPIVVSGHIHDRYWLQENILYTGSLYPITTSESNDKGVINGTYNIQENKLSFTVTRVITSQKKVLKIECSDQDAIREMIHLEREHTKYIVQGTHDEIAIVKHQIEGKNINITYDLRIPDPLSTSNKKNQTYDEIMRELVTERELILLLEEIMA
jgi:DNA repair exonuclease SbcCD nuclease subunit